MNFSCWQYLLKAFYLVFVLHFSHLIKARTVAQDFLKILILKAQWLNIFSQFKHFLNLCLFRFRSVLDLFGSQNTSIVIYNFMFDV
jgi:hypothetical protein